MNKLYTVLVIGFGKAGKRHLRSLTKMQLSDKYSFQISLYDPLMQEMLNNPDHDFSSVIDYASNSGCKIESLETSPFSLKRKWDIVVIASPPSEHLWQMDWALNSGAHVLCEKPLCDFGQLEIAKLIIERPDVTRAMVAYNYHFNPDLKLPYPVDEEHGLYLLAKQYRKKLPTWGILLDNISHDIDIIRNLSQQNIVFNFCRKYESDVWQKYVFGGTLENMDKINIQIVDEISTVYPEGFRSAGLSNATSRVNITANPVMFENMWLSFLDHIESGLPQLSSVDSAYETQLLLEKAYLYLKKDGAL